MTFSICTHVTPEEHDAGDGPAFAVAVATKAPAVGALCPYVSHEGAVSTQAFVNVRLGRRGIALLDDLAVDDALPGLLEQDEHSELRQLHGVDYRGNTFAFTSDECDEWCGHEVRDGITAAGNMLEGAETPPAVINAFENAEGRIGERLLDALAAGVETGGDKRGHSSAAILIKAPQTTAFHGLQVDEHETPVADLRRVYDAAVDASDGFSEESKERIFD
ncbi:DUF1028 domain-containing protein [Halolamina sp.]|uniref:DUF1028 domain-containing protein n=1 Tax=Halolamina sp. TaxID=1940283 RepID=UPI00356B52FC